MDYRTHVDNELFHITSMAPITISQPHPGLIRLSTPSGIVTGDGFSIFETSDMFVTAFLAFEKNMAIVLAVTDL